MVNHVTQDQIPIVLCYKPSYYMYVTHVKLSKNAWKIMKDCKIVKNSNWGTAIILYIHSDHEIKDHFGFYFLQGNLSQWVHIVDCLQLMNRHGVSVMEGFFSVWLCALFTANCWIHDVKTELLIYPWYFICLRVFTGWLGFSFNIHVYCLWMLHKYLCYYFHKAASGKTALYIESRSTKISRSKVFTDCVRSCMPRSNILRIYLSLSVLIAQVRYKSNMVLSFKHFYKSCLRQITRKLKTCLLIIW